jgi:DNA transformation protein and related proteins
VSHTIRNRQKHEISRLPNIGKVMAEKLKHADIHSYHELKKVGAEKAFLRLKAEDEGACLSSLCALEGAIEGVRWHDLAKEKKDELKRFFEQEKYSSKKKFQIPKNKSKINSK